MVPCSLASYCCKPLSCWCSVFSLAAAPKIAIDGDSPPDVMHTSGSTGAPKSVLVPNRAVVRLVSDQRCIEFDAAQIFLLHSPLSFDASTLEFWGCLLHGPQLAWWRTYLVGVWMPLELAQDADASVADAGDARAGTGDGGAGCRNGC